MADRVDYQDYADECVRQAGEAKAPEQKELLLKMAQAWGRLAKQSERIRSLVSRTTEGRSDDR
jgi:hypothetical protein